MTINGINGVNTQSGQAGMKQAMDTYSRNLQNRIANAQKQLQELSSKEDMSPEEKVKKRQEIQQQINDLNMQLRQHQMEQRKEKQANSSSMSSTGNAGNAKVKSTSAGLSQANMTAIISADNSIKQAKIQGDVAARMEGRAGVLKSEIKNSHGGNVEKKQEELADIEQKAQSAAESQLSTIAGVNKTMKEAEKTEDKEFTEKNNEEDENLQTGDKMNEEIPHTAAVNASIPRTVNLDVRA